MILCSLPNSWDILVMVVCNSIFRSGTLNFDDMVGVILNEEICKKTIGESLGNSLVVENNRILNERGKGPRNYGKSKKGWSE